MAPQAPPTAPSDPVAQYQHALALHQAGRLEEAASAYRAMLASFPSNPLLMTGLGTIALQQGNVAEGIRQLEASLAIEPNQPLTLSNLGIALWHVHRAADAVAAFDRAIALHPEFAEAYNHRGVVLHAMGRPADALASLDRAVALDPGYAEAYSNRGVVLTDLDRADEALVSLDRAIALNPGYAEALNNRGNVLRMLGRSGDALESFDRAVVLRPGYAEAWSNRGNALHDMGRLDDALADYHRAIGLDPAYAEGWSNRGTALLDLRRVLEARADYDRAIALKPDHAAAHWNKALLELLLGEYEEGWRLHEWRWKDCRKPFVRNFPQPLWLGDAQIAGKTLLIHAEQGYGDFIQFCRYLPMLDALGAKVVVEAFAPLLPLLSSMKGGFSVVPSGRPLPHFDLHCPVMSLPLAFRTTLNTIPANVPYLAADPDRLSLWRQRLGPKARMRVGLAWSGNPAQKDNHNRSIPFRLLSPLLALPADFHVLQKDIYPEDAAEVAGFSNVHVHSAALRDFADTAALAQEMDLVISVCTSIAHLAGAMGRPLWVLLSARADWRWLLDRSDSPWYPSATLFRQPAIGDWASVISQVAARLQAMAGDVNSRLRD